jgi:hypothetical protein
VLRTRLVISIFVVSSLFRQNCVPAHSATPPPPQTAATQKSDENELNTILMQATFKVQSVPVPGQPLTLGVVFIMGRPILNPPPDQPNAARFVLITAAHVLDEIPGDFGILNLRRRNNQGDWERLPTPMKIRVNGQPLWVKHPSADVAVMYVELPVSIPLLSTDLLADDTTLERFGIHPGDTLQCLGFPFGLESNPAGFPVLRSGRIASYPLVPTAKTQTFLFDFNVFQGNSGGPVYMVDQNRVYYGNIHFGQTTQFIAGLVTQETTHNEQIVGQYNAEMHRYPLGLATVVHANFIREAINMLPAAETPLRLAPK